MNEIKSILLGPAEMSQPLVWLQRKETWAGDVKANLIRAVGLFLFTINEMLNYHMFQVVDKKFHVGSLLIIGIWYIATIDFHFLLKRHLMPRAVPYLMPTVDVILITWLIILGDGPKSALTGVYFLILALAALRLYPAVVLYTSAACALGYLGTWIYSMHRNPMFAVPHYHVAIIILCLILMGVILAHGLTRVYMILNDYRKQGAGA